MRNLRLLALLAPALLFPLACEDSSSSSGGTFSLDAGPGFEAGPTPEAGPLPDGALPDAFAPLGVTVTVLEGATPKKDVRVIFQDSTGAVTGQAKTDAAGKVAIAAAPSMVTVLTTRAGDRPAAVTFAAVVDGDNLRVVAPAPNGGAPAGSYDVSFVAGDPLITNANGFEVHAANNAGFDCQGFGSDPSGTVRVDLYAYCVAAKNAVLATASNPGGILGFSFAKNVLAPVGTAVVAVSLPLFTAPGKTTVQASNLPVGAGISTSASLFAIANGQPTMMGGTTGAIAGGVLDFPTPTGFAEAYQTVIKARSGAGPVSERALVRREATAAPALAPLANFDFSTALPVISGATFAQPTPARPDITLTTAAPASLATSDAGIVAVSWFAPSIDSSGSWVFVLPPNTTAFKVPALPADAGAFVPTNDTFRIESATFFDASQLPSYQAAKALPIAPEVGVDFVEPTRPLPAAGTLRVSRCVPNGG